MDKTFVSNKKLHIIFPFYCSKDCFLFAIVYFQAVMNRIHTISVPYAVMKACPLSWVQRVHIHKGELHSLPKHRMLNKCQNYYDNIFVAARAALVKCRDLHWAMMAHRDQRDTSLASLRMLIVADGANPCKDFTHITNIYLFQFVHTVHVFMCFHSIPSSSGSVSSCDAFLNVFQSHGLKPEVICPCATSPEAMTVAIRRYGRISMIFMT